jgi:hypothetical protein
MANIRRVTLGQALSSVTAFHGFNVASNGDLQYTKMDSGDLDIQNADQEEQYVMYEISTDDFVWKINDDGELIVEFETDD